MREWRVLSKPLRARHFDGDRVLIVAVDGVGKCLVTGVGGSLTEGYLTWYRVDFGQDAEWLAERD